MIRHKYFCIKTCKLQVFQIAKSIFMLFKILQDIAKVFIRTCQLLTTRLFVDICKIIKIKQTCLAHVETSSHRA